MKLTMRLGARSYDIILKRGALKNLSALINLNRKVFIVTDSGVPARYAETVRAQCKEGLVYTVPQGEGSKSLAVYQKLLEAMLEAGFGRGDAVVAVGGGVVGDLAGFVAATYMRGVDFINCPTTTLSQIDSSIGGKVAVDLGRTKNIVGAFWQPKMVICDTDTFHTLPEDTFADGVAETVKHGLIADADFFRFLMSEDIRGHIDDVVRRNVEIKAAVVNEDEFERGRRKILNFGHTLGHAVEKCSGFTITHGHAVAIGMVMASRAAEKMGFSPAGILETVLACNRRFGLPTDCPYTAQEVYAAATSDKKRSGSSIDVVVLKEIGRAETVRLDMEGLREFTEAAVAFS